MPFATLTQRGQIVIPAKIRLKYELKPGMQVEFVDEDGAIRLIVRRRVVATEADDGYGMIKVKPSASGRARRSLLL